MKHPFTAAMAMVAALAAWPQVGRADSFAISGTGSLGAFSGIFEYLPSSPTEGTISITLTNTSPALNGGYITGFAFNYPSTATVTGVSFSADYADFALLGGTTLDTINAAPYGTFDVGSTTGSNWEGGNTHGAVGVGETAHFEFDLTGTGLGSLGAADFLSALSAQNNTKPGQEFVVRFQGFEDGGSDKVPADTVTHTPEPATLALLGAGLLGLALRRRLA